MLFLFYIILSKLHFLLNFCIPSKCKISQIERPIDPIKDIYISNAKKGPTFRMRLVISIALVCCRLRRYAARNVLLVAESVQYGGAVGRELAVVKVVATYSAATVMMVAEMTFTLAIRKIL